MASNLKTLDSLGGFSIGNTPLVNDKKDIQNANSVEVRNSFFQDSSTSYYILRGLNTSTLALDNVGNQIILPSNTINFITANVVGVNDTGGGHISSKIESAVSVGSTGTVLELSSMTTIIKDSIPEGQTWTIEPFDTGSANRYSLCYC
jgi:2-iminoacetate synthase ThiH